MTDDCGTTSSKWGFCVASLCIYTVSLYSGGFNPPLGHLLIAVIFLVVGTYVMFGPGKHTHYFRSYYSLWYYLASTLILPYDFVRANVFGVKPSCVVLIAICRTVYSYSIFLLYGVFEC